MPNLLSARNLDRPAIEMLLASARTFADGGRHHRRHADAVVALMFFQESLRTRVGFDIAAARLGARTAMIAGGKHDVSVMLEPESFEDAIRSVAGWCDAICVRHPDAAAPRIAAELAATSIVNCGNGWDEHPTQALIDLFAITSLVGALDGIRIGLIGDLATMRSAHSLLVALSRFDEVMVRCMAPASLEMPDTYASTFTGTRNRLEQTNNPRFDDLDVIYVAGLPKRVDAAALTLTDRARYRIDASVVAALRPGARVLCPLPRLDEIAVEVDASTHAGYFEQSKLGLPVRMAILDYALGGITQGRTS